MPAACFTPHASYLVPHASCLMPASSPDLNAAEHMWPAILKDMKRMEQKLDKFVDFKRKLLRAARKYSTSEKLVRSMAGRMHDCCKRYGGILPK